MRPLSTVPAEPSMLPGTGFGSAPCAITSVPPFVGPLAPAAGFAAGATVATGATVAGAVVGAEPAGAAAVGPEAGAGDWQAANRYSAEVAAAPSPTRRMNPRRVTRSRFIT